MKIFYSRVSSVDGSQNHDRQLVNTVDFDYVITDNFTGNSDLFERPKGKEIKKLLDQGKLTHLEVHSIDRLGRNLLSVLNTWKELTDKGVLVVCRNPSIRNFDHNGQPDKFSELILSILGSMYSFEREMILARQKEGIAIAKATKPHAYIGRRIGSKDSPEKYINKPKNKQILQYLKKENYSYVEISRIVKCSYATITKTKKIAMELGVL